MHAILLAAGVGRRLNSLTGGGPKCLLPIDGASLLERHLACLNELGVANLTVVTGFEAMQIEQALGSLVPRIAPEMTVTTIQNPDFRQGSALSVLAAEPAMSGDTPILLMDADVLYDTRMLAPLLATGRDDCCLFDREFEAGEEPVKLCLKAGRIVGFDKQLPTGLDYDTIGESVGFFRLTPATARRVAERCRQFADIDAETPHEHALRDVMLEAQATFGHADVTGLPWIEIDYPEDAERADREIAPRLVAGAVSR